MTTAIAAKNRKVQTQKIVHIIARYAIKMGGQFTGVIVYLVLASKGDMTYRTTLLNGKATGCTCPANKPCYHMTQLEQKEQERIARKLIASTVETVETAKFRTFSYGVSSKGVFIQQYRDGGWYKMCDMNGDEVIVNRKDADGFIETLHDCAETGPVYVERDYTRTGYSVKCDALVNAIRDGEIVECLWSRLSASERSEARANSGY